MIWATEIPGTPPSVNELPLDTRNWKYRKTRNQWKQDMSYAMSERGNVLPRKLERVTARALLLFTTKARRDEGNYRSHLEKWLGDVLQENGRLVDDTPDHFSFDRVAFGVGRTPVTVIVCDYRVRCVA